MAQEFNSSNMLQLILKWKKQLIIVLIISVGSSAFFSSSLFITPKYKSTAVAYPINLLPYGEESTTEQLLPLLQSVAVRDCVLTKFHLAQHYKIDDSYPLGKSYVLAEWSENVTIGKTDLESARPRRRARPQRDRGPLVRRDAEPVAAVPVVQPDAVPATAAVAVAPAPAADPIIVPPAPAAADIKESLQHVGLVVIETSHSPPAADSFAPVQPLGRKPKPAATIASEPLQMVETKRD